MFRFQCGKCDRWHEGAPSAAFGLPDLCAALPPEERESRLNYHEDMVALDLQYFFIRACLRIPIENTDECFLWGLWVSVSKDSFGHYLQSYEEPAASGQYFSWLANNLPGYPAVDGLKSTTLVQPRGMRPLVQLENSNHPLSIDFHRGISMTRARELFESILHPAPRL